MYDRQSQIRLLSFVVGLDIMCCKIKKLLTCTNAVRCTPKSIVKEKSVYLYWLQVHTTLLLYVTLAIWRNFETPISTKLHIVDMSACYDTDRNTYVTQNLDGNVQGLAI
jgi:hypothetical protein